MVEWSALFNCLRMRFVKIGTDNEMPGRIKLSQPGRDNLPFRAGICGEIGGEVCSCHFWSPGEPRRRGPPWAKVCCREALPTTMERARRTMRKTAVRPIGEPFYGFRKDPGRVPSSPAQFLRGASCPCSSRSSLQPRFVVARRAANGLDLVRNTRTGPVAICTSRSGLIKGIVMSG